VALWPDSIVLAGATIPLASVLADVTIHHGRQDVNDEPTASTCQLTFHDVTHAFAKGFRVGDTLTVTVRDGAAPALPRFTGRITDASLDVDELTAIATAKLSTLSQYVIGATGTWPVEAWSARVSRCFAEAGLSSDLVLQPEPGFDPPLAARDSATAGPTTLADYLTFLAPMIGAAVTDQRDGKILVQAIGARTLGAATSLDPALVEYAPVWTQALPAGNIVTVRYTGDQSESVTVQDDSSIAVYGKRPRTIDTSFTASADATARAQSALARGSFSHWNIPAAPVLAGLDLSVGQPISLSSMPPASPEDPWQPILEGWTDTITRDDWRMDLALSDPLVSGLLLPWNAIPSSYLWNSINQTVVWRDALSLADLGA